MHHYLLGILLVQLITIVLLLINLDSFTGLESIDTTLLLKVGVPVVTIALFSAFWFDSIAKRIALKQVHRASKAHAKERETIQVKAERAKTHIIKESHKQINQQSNRVHAKANFKVGLAFAGALAAAGIMLITELLTLGLLTLTTAGGALGGYFMRAKQERSNRLQQQGESTEKSGTKLLTHMRNIVQKK